MEYDNDAVVDDLENLQYVCLVHWWVRIIYVLVMNWNACGADMLLDIL